MPGIRPPSSTLITVPIAADVAIAIAAGCAGSASLSSASWPFGLSPTVTASPSCDQRLHLGQQRHARRAVEEHLGRRGQPAVAVVGVQLVGPGEPLLEEPAATGVDARVEGDAGARRRRWRRAARTSPAAPRATAAGASGSRPACSKADLVVVEDRVADVERHRPLHAVGLVGEQHPGQERRLVEALGLHARADRDHALGVGHLLDHVLRHHHHLRAGSLCPLWTYLSIVSL